MNAKHGHDQQNKGAVAVIAAHPDDEVLGCGGTIARMAQEGRAVHILLLADGESSRVESEETSSTASAVFGRNAAAEKAAEILGCQSVQLLSLPDNRLDRLELLDVVKHIEVFLARYQPATVFTHHRDDVNIDHRITHDAVLAACRPQPEFFVKELFFFEVPSSTEWRPSGSGIPFNPNYFFNISKTSTTKIQALEAYHAEMREFPHPRSYQAIDALMRWRGASVGVAAAEAFVLGRRLV